jgi:hypothetical protein
MVFFYKPGIDNIKSVLEAAFNDCKATMMKTTENHADIIFNKINWQLNPIQFQKEMRIDRKMKNKL